MTKLRAESRRRVHERLGEETIVYRARCKRSAVDPYALSWGLVHLALAGRHDEVRTTLINRSFVGASHKAAGQMSGLVLA